MQITLITVGFGILLFSIWEPASAVTCYHCNSLENTDCLTISSKTPQKSNCKFCLKAHQITDGLEDDLEILHRGCWDKSVGSVCEKSDIRNSVKSDVCTCDADLCNAAPRHVEMRLGNWAIVLPLLSALNTLLPGQF